MIIENPYHSMIWRRRIVKRMLGLKGVVRVVGCMCAYGLRGPGGGPLKKPLGFLCTEGMAEALNRRCRCREPHERIEGTKLTRSTAECPTGLVDSILKRLNQIRQQETPLLGRLDEGEPADKYWQVDTVAQVSFTDIGRDEEEWRRLLHSAKQYLQANRRNNLIVPEARAVALDNQSGAMGGAADSGGDGSQGQS